MNSVYTQDLLDEANNPQNYGELKKIDLRSSKYNASCGDVISITVKLSKDRLKIEDIAWKGQGCIISQSAMSILSQKIKGLEIIKVVKVTKEDLLNELGLSKLAIGRTKCLMLGLEAVKEMLGKV